MHSWHCGLAARIVPSCFGDEKLELGMPATLPLVSRSTSTEVVLALRREFSPRASMNVNFNLSRRCPMASNFSKPKPIGSTRLWQPAHDWLVVCDESRSRLVIGLASVTGGRLVFTPGGGSGTCWQRNCSRTNRPRAVGDESSGLAVDARNRP